MANHNVLERITTALSDVCDLYYGVADTDNYPFVVYSVEAEPFYSKNGVYKYECDVKFAICGKTFDEVDNLSNLIDPILKQLKSYDLSVYEKASQTLPDENNYWLITRQYTFKQFINQ